MESQKEPFPPSRSHPLCKSEKRVGSGGPYVARPPHLGDWTTFVPLLLSQQETGGRWHEKEEEEEEGCMSGETYTRGGREKSCPSRGVHSYMLYHGKEVVIPKTT